MLKSLKDPSLPAGAIIEEFDDGGALRNDGVRLKPANQNPWYVLATAFGEAVEKNALEDFASYNRDAWNRFLVKLSKDKVTSTDLKQLEINGPRLIEPRTHECEHHVQAKFYKYFKYGTEILKHQPIIDLSETYFPQDVDLTQRLFSLPIKIHRASFAGSLSLNMSLAKEFVQITDTLICGDLSGEDMLAQVIEANSLHVGGRFSLSRKAEIHRALALDRVNARVLDLSGSTIEGQTVVSNSNIKVLSAENLVTPILALTSVSAKTVRFDYATFDQGLLKELETEDEASFRNVKVEDTFKLTNSAIRGGATFDGLTVSSKAAFIEGNELTNASFNEAVFKNSTDFTGTRFRGSAPRFFGATLHEDTIFETARENYPETSTRNLDRDIHAYGRLRLYAKQQDRPDEEHFFMRLEMRSKEARASRFYRILYWLYRQLSDYGYSVGRPLAGLAITIVFGWAFLGSYAQLQSGLSGSAGVFRGFGVSFSSTFSFLGLGRRFHGDFFDSTSPWLDFLSGFQTVVGVILVFLLGLGLRNHFRLK